jgi:replication factor C subunit 3/5
MYVYLYNKKQIMFLFEKYRPTNINDFLFNKDILDQLMHIATNEDIPHIIISGPQGGGKKTLVKFFLEALYDPDINNLNKIKYNINGASGKKEIEIMQSNYHIIIEPTNTNHDKYILQEIIRQYAMHKSFDIYKTKRNFKTIVIYNIENLANNSQAALRRTMERYAKTCRFVMICNNLSKIFDPLRSRCRIFCVPLPSLNDISNVISHISIMESIKLADSDMNYILTNCENSLGKAIWILDCMRLNSNSTITLDEVFNIVVDLIFSVRTGKNVVKIFDDDIRTNIYNILITNIKGSEIIMTLMTKLIKRINDDEINARIIQCASAAEYNLIHGRRDIKHIDYFVAGAMKELRKNIKTKNTDPKK